MSGWPACARPSAMGPTTVRTTGRPLCPPQLQLFWSDCLGFRQNWIKHWGWARAGCSHQREGREGRERCLGGKEVRTEIWEQCLLLLLLSLTSPSPAHTLPGPPWPQQLLRLSRSHMQAKQAAGPGLFFRCRQRPAWAEPGPHCLPQPAEKGRFHLPVLQSVLPNNFTRPLSLTGK